MAEHVKYRGRAVNIGTRDNLYYTTYQQFTSAFSAGYLSPAEYSLTPSAYLQPDSGFRFRFPFPDEDHLSIGQHTDHDRGVSIAAPASLFDNEKVSTPNHATVVELIQQKLIHRQSDGTLCLAIVCRLPGSWKSFRVQDDQDLQRILHATARQYILNAPTPAARAFYRSLCVRILKGYRLENNQEAALHQRQRQISGDDNGQHLKP